jgi:hypothetical protein
MSDPDSDAAANLLERRWFSTIAAIRATQSECDLLREVLEISEASWRQARAKLAELEQLRDALGDELIYVDDDCSRAAAKPTERSVRTAA